MVKVQDTYNPITGEYVKKISDWLSLDGSLPWLSNTGSWVGGFKNLYTEGITATYGAMNTSNSSMVLDFKSKQLLDGTFTKDCKMLMATSGTGRIVINPSDIDTGFNEITNPTQAEVKAYFYGYKLANSDGTSPYYKSEVPYTPATWTEWVTTCQTVTYDSTGISFLSNGCQANIPWTSVKASTKYGILWNCVSKTSGGLYIGGGTSVFTDFLQKNSIGNNKYVATTMTDITARNKIFNLWASGKSQFKLKDIRVFELPTGSQIEADFTNLTADELSAKYTFNGLCVKHWKKVTDGTGLTSTLPTASYEGYTPYRMIYQLATPEISYLTPKATIPFYDTNTIVETDTPTDCKADMTVGYKLKDGVTAVAGDITAPTPDYMSSVNSVSEDGLKKGIAQSPNIVTNGNFANGTTNWNGHRSMIESNGYLLQTNKNQYKFQDYVFPAGNKIYASAKMKSSSGFGAYLNLSDYGAFSNLVSAVTNIDSVWYKKSLIRTSTGAGTRIMLGHYSSNVVIECNYDDVTVIDLTASFGAGNEPTQAQCDILFATWQDKASTQATLPTLRKIGTVADTYNPETGVLVQRIGKKVFDGTELTSISIGDGNSVVITKPIENLYYGNTYYSPFIGSHHMKMTGVPNVDWNKSINYGKGCVSTNSSLWLSVDNKKINTISEAQEWFAQQYANGTPVTVYYQLATPIVTTLTKTALPTYKPTTVIESDSTVKGTVSTDYKLKANATPVAGDFIASPESVNDIKDLGNSIDVVSSNKNKGQVDLSAIPYNTITDWTYKTNILLSAPLRSVGDVKDRLFKDSDGKWKIERNIGEYVATGFETSWIYAPTLSSNLKDVFEMTSSIYIPKYIGRANSFLRISCSHFNEFLSANPPINNMRLQSGDATINGTWLTVGINNLSFGGDVTKFKDWLKSEFNKGTPVTIQYEKTPTYEILSQELQTKLDNIPTFPEHNYVYTVANDNLQPTLHVDYKKLSWLKSRLLLNSLKIYSRNLTDAEMIQNYKVEKERFGM